METTAIIEPHDESIEQIINECDEKTKLSLSKARDWGVWEIVRDLLSNHLPADCGDETGQLPEIKIKQDKHYVSIQDVDREKPVSEIVIEDKGEGYHWNELSFMASDKPNNPLSVGQHGEGIKYAAAAAVRDDIQIKFLSRNWKANAYHDEIIRDPEKEKKDHVLCYHIIENGHRIKGSKTIFLNPTKELLDEVLKIPEKFIYFNTTYKRLFAEDAGEKYAAKIIDTDKEHKSLFNKGVWVMNLEQAIFDYDLGLEKITSNRDDVNDYEKDEKIRELLTTCTNPEVIKNILTNAETRKEAYEFDALRIYSLLSCKDPKNKQVWLDTFEELYGKNAVLASGRKEIDDYAMPDFKPIMLNSRLHEFLAKTGIKPVADIPNDENYMWVEYDDLTELEKEILEAKTKQINSFFLKLHKNLTIDDVNAEVKVYSGKETKSGRELDCESNQGVHITYSNGKKLIGLYKRLMENPADLGRVYTHESGHHITEAKDNTREFTEFFVDSVAKAADYTAELEKKIEEKDQTIQELKKMLGLKAEEKNTRTKLPNLIEKLYNIKNGNRMRQVVRIVAKAYKQNPEQLKEYFNHEHDKLAGIATSAYHLLTGDIMPIQETEYGGLGAIIEKSEKGLEFRKCQLQFAKLSKRALQKSKNKEQALQYSENIEQALQDSMNSEQALQYSINKGETLQNSINKGETLQNSINKGEALKYSKNENQTLQHSRNTNQTLWHSKNTDTSLHNSINEENALWHSENTGNALEKSQNTGDTLYKSKNSKESLWYSENRKRSLQESQNSGESLYKSKNQDDTLYHSVNTGEALQESENIDNALTKSENSGYGVLKKSTNMWLSLTESINSNSLWQSQNSGFALKHSQNSDSALKYSQNSGCALLKSKNKDQALQYSENTNHALLNSKNEGSALKDSIDSGTVPEYIKEHLQALAV